MRVSEHPSRAGILVAAGAARVNTVDSKAAVAQFAVSTDSEDRYGSVIDAVGIQTDNFMRNPVILYGHDMKSLPIGRAIALHRTTNSLVAKIQFAVTQNEQAATIWNLVRDGFLTGASIGFQPLASVPFKAKLTPPALAENLRYTRVELLEISIVSVPANTNALKMAVDRGLVSARSLGLLHLRLAPEWQPSSRSLAMMESYFRERYR